MKSATELKTDVEQELHWEPSVSAEHIGVAVKNGMIELHGHVASLFEKWGAEQAALRVAGVRSIASEIVVDPSPASERTDADIALTASNYLNWNSLIPDTVQLKVTDGWVTLEGKTEWQFQREEAERVVRPLFGVKGITNEIRLIPNISIPTIKANIQDALKRGAQTDAENIQVETEGGTVTLRGKVQSWRERRAAEDAAFNAPGVAGVANFIAVGN